MCFLWVEILFLSTVWASNLRSFSFFLALSFFFCFRLSLSSSLRCFEDPLEDFESDDCEYKIWVNINATCLVFGSAYLFCGLNHDWNGTRTLLPLFSGDGDWGFTTDTSAFSAARTRGPSPLGQRQQWIGVILCKNNYTQSNFLQKS